MFCYQCEQTSKGTGCTIVGACGKDSDTSALQDLLIYTLQGLSLYALEGRKRGIVDRNVNIFTCKALFSTLTNVNFDADRFPTLIKNAVELRDSLKTKLEDTVDFGNGPATFTLENTLEGMIAQGEKVGLHSDPSIHPDILSLQHTLLFGIKGVAAYADHAQILGQEDDIVYAFLHEALAQLTRKDLDINEWLGLVLKCGEVNLRTMELLDAANTGAYGHPAPTPVSIGYRKGKAILVSGHDLKDLDALLKQTEGMGISIYTHGEMLPAHGYPALKKYPHFYGHFGTAWFNQQKEFPQFPGAILMTTNCIQKPKPIYQDNIFTTGLVGWPGVVHVQNQDFSAVIEKALEMPGFQEDRVEKEVLVGFGRNTVLGVADQVIEAIEQKDIRHFFLVAGCDGAKPGRNYFTELVEKIPDDCVVLTLACGKFRFFDKQLGTIGDIPRLMDMGQCNDAYSAIQVALALAKTFDVGVNELPLSLILSWYEQKAVAILLTLLYLGIKDIRLGPTLPAFISSNILDVLVKNFDIKPITTPDEDLKTILG
jgi:hydroxylamine reductase